MYDKTDQIRLQLKEPQTAHYIYVDENTGDLHLLIPFNSGRDISLDNTCKIMVEISNFFGQYEHNSLAIQSLRQYEEGLKADLLIIPQNHPLRPQKEKRLRQVNAYIDAVNALRDVFREEFYNLIEIPSNLSIIQLRPLEVDEAFEVKKPVFHLDRELDDSGTIKSALFNALQGVFETVNLGRKHPRQVLEEQTLKVLAKNFTFNDVQVALENTCNILFKAKLSTESEESNVVDFHRNPKNEPVTQEYIDATLGLDEDENASAGQYINSLILVCASDLWTSLSLSPFYSFDVNGHPDTKELVEHLSLTTQFFLGNMNVYCKVKGISQADFGSILDKHAVLSMSLAVTVKNALNKGLDVEQVIMDFIQKHHRVFEFAQDRKLETKHRNEIISQFNRNYGTITGTPENEHWDDFMLVDLESNDESAIFVSHQNHISLHAAVMLRSANITNTIITDVYPGFKQVARELPPYNKFENYMVIEDKEEYIAQVSSENFNELPKAIIIELLKFDVGKLVEKIDIVQFHQLPKEVQEVCERNDAFLTLAHNRFLNGKPLDVRLREIAPDDVLPAGVQKLLNKPILAAVLNGENLEKKLSLMTDADFNGYKKVVQEALLDFDLEKLLSEISFKNYLLLPAPIKDACLKKEGFSDLIGKKIAAESSPEELLETVGYDGFFKLQQPVQQYCYQFASFQAQILEEFKKKYEDNLFMEYVMKYAYNLSEEQFNQLPDSIKKYLIDFDLNNTRMDTGKFSQLPATLKTAWKEAFAANISQFVSLSLAEKELLTFNLEKFVAITSIWLYDYLHSEVLAVCEKDERFESMVLNKYLAGRTIEVCIMAMDIAEFKKLPSILKKVFKQPLFIKLMNGQSKEQKIASITESEFNEYPKLIKTELLSFDVTILFSLIKFSDFLKMPNILAKACYKKPGFDELIVALFSKEYTPESILDELDYTKYISLPMPIRTFCNESPIFKNKILDLFKHKYSTSSSIVELLKAMASDSFNELPSSIKQYLFEYPLTSEDFIFNFIEFNNFPTAIRDQWSNNHEIKQKMIQQVTGNKDVEAFWAEYNESTCSTNLSYVPEFITQHLLNFDVPKLVQLCGPEKFERLPGFVTEKCQQDPQLSCYLLFAAFAQRTKERSTVGIFRGLGVEYLSFIRHAIDDFDIEYFLNNLPYEDFDEVYNDVNNKCKRHPNYQKILLNRYLNGKDLEERLANTSEDEYEKLPEDIKEQCKKYDLNKLIQILNGRRTGIPNHIVRVIERNEFLDGKTLEERVAQLDEEKYWSLTPAQREFVNEFNLRILNELISIENLPYLPVCVQERFARIGGYTEYFMCYLQAFVPHGMLESLNYRFSYMPNSRIYEFITTQVEITDYSGREFTCTPLEYAYWSNNFEMCQLFQKYLHNADIDTKQKVALILTNMESRINNSEPQGLTYTQNGKAVNSLHFDLNPLITELMKLSDQVVLMRHSQNPDTKKINQCIKRVCQLQLDLPAHVARMYRPEKAAEEKLLYTDVPITYDAESKKVAFWYCKMKPDKVIFQSSENGAMHFDLKEENWWVKLNRQDIKQDIALMQTMQLNQKKGLMEFREGMNQQGRYGLK